MSRFFTEKELFCGCRRPGCEAKKMDMNFMFKIDGLRIFLGVPLHVESARRCEFWNKHVGGKDHSLHLEGRAIDLRIDSDSLFWRLAKCCTLNGLSFGRISQTAVHVDNRDGEPKFFFYAPKAEAE